MSAYKPYRSRQVVEAKQLDHAGSNWDPRTGRKEDFQAGDWLVRDSRGKAHIEQRERFLREYESLGDNP